EIIGHPSTRIAWPRCPVICQAGARHRKSAGLFIGFTINVNTILRAEIHPCTEIPVERDIVIIRDGRFIENMVKLVAVYRDDGNGIFQRRIDDIDVLYLKCGFQLPGQYCRRMCSASVWTDEYKTDGDSGNQYTRKGEASGWFCKKSTVPAFMAVPLKPDIQ